MLCSKCCRAAAVRQTAPFQQLRRVSRSSLPLDPLASDLPRSTRYSRPRQREFAPASIPTPTSTAGTVPRLHPDNLHDYVTATSKQRYARRPLTRPGSVDHPARPSPSFSASASSRDKPEHAYAAAPDDKKRDTPLIAYTSELQDLVRKHNVDAAWAYFEAHYTSPDCPALDIDCLGLIDALKHRDGRVYIGLLSLMTRRWLDQLQASPTHTADTTPVTPTAVLIKFEQLGISSPSTASSAAWALVLNLHRAAADGLDPLHHPTTEPVFVQLVELLPLCFFPRSDDTSALYYRGRFSRLFNRDGEKPSKLHISLLLIQDLLCRAESLPKSLDQHAPFLKALGWAVSQTSLTQSAIHHIHTKLTADLHVTDELTSRLRHLGIAPVLANSPTVDPPTSKTETMAQKTRRMVFKISQATMKQNLDTVERIWAQAQPILKDQSVENSPFVLRLYETFLDAFFKLRRTQSGLQVWNSMLQSGFEPSVRTWNVMMKSCHVSRDLDIMESMWHHMRKSGVQPDVISWSTRIYGHLRSGSVRDGMFALDEMAREWLACQSRRRSDANTAMVAKPDVAIFNAAISALRGKRSQYIPQVLAWSQSFNIEPDVATYNSLLSSALAQGKSSADAAKILQRMAASNVKPDAVTSAILVNQMLSTTHLQDLTHQEQRDQIIKVIDEFEECGMVIDVKGYALLVDRMLKEHGNAQAARDIIKHMVAHKIEHTPHIYTIVMTHYFDSNPPDLAAVDGLWNEIKNSGSDRDMDVIFFDRMVEGWARHGNKAKAMEFLTDMSRQGKRPGWLALLEMVQCLGRKEDWRGLVTLVRDCHEQDRLLSVGARGVKGRVEFWEHVERVAENELNGSAEAKEMLAIVNAQIYQRTGQTYG
jgi:pentatricopeptide repeat protein